MHCYIRHIAARQLVGATALADAKHTALHACAFLCMQHTNCETWIFFGICLLIIVSISKENDKKINKIRIIYL